MTLSTTSAQNFYLRRSKIEYNSTLTSLLKHSLGRLLNGISSSLHSKMNCSVSLFWKFFLRWFVLDNLPATETTSAILMQENFISSSSSVKTRLKIHYFYRFFRRNSSSPEIWKICFNNGRCVSPAWVSDLLGDFHKNQEKVLKFLVEIVTKLQVIATERFLKEQKKPIYPNERVHREAAF